MSFGNMCQCSNVRGDDERNRNLGSFNSPTKLEVERKVEINPPEFVNSGIEIEEERKVDIRVLEYVNSGIEIEEDRKVDIHALENVNSGIEIEEERKVDIHVLEYVNSGIDIEENRKVDIHAIEYVNSGIEIEEDKKVDIPVLEYVNSGIEIEEDRKVDIHVLEYVNSGIEIEEDRKVDIHALENVSSVSSGIEIEEEIKLVINALENSNSGINIEVGRRINIHALGNLVEDRSEVDTQAMENSNNGRGQGKKKRRRRKSHIGRRQRERKENRAARERKKLILAKLQAEINPTGSEVGGTPPLNKTNQKIAKVTFMSDESNRGRVLQYLTDLPDLAKTAIMSNFEEFISDRSRYLTREQMVFMDRAVNRVRMADIRARMTPEEREIVKKKKREKKALKRSMMSPQQIAEIRHRAKIQRRIARAKLRKQKFEAAKKRMKELKALQRSKLAAEKAAKTREKKAAQAKLRQKKSNKAKEKVPRASQTIDRSSAKPELPEVISYKDLQPIVNVSGNLQGYLVHGQTPFLLTPVSGSSHLFMVHQNGKETPTLKEQSLLPGTILNLKAMLEKDPPALPPLPASSIPTSLTATSLPHTANPINISTSTVINYQPVFVNQQQGSNSQLVYTSSQQPLSRDHASDQTRDGGVQYVVVDKSNNNSNNLQVSTASMNTGRLPIVDNKHTMNSAPKQPMAMGGVSRDGFVFHNITFSTAENGTTTRVNPAISPAITPTINAASVFSNQVEARAARVMVGSSTKRYMPIAPAPGGNSSSSSSSHSQRPLLLPNQAPTAQYNTSNQPFIQPAHLQPAQPTHLQPAHIQPNQPAHLQPQSGQFPAGHVTTGPGPSGQTIIAQTIPGGYQPFPHEQTLQQNPNFQNIQPQNLQAQRVYNVLNLQPIPQPQVDQQKQMSGHQQQQQQQQQIHTQQQVINQHPPQQTQQQQQPNVTAQNSGSASKNPGDREAKLKMVMNSLSQVLSLPIQQQKEVFKNNPILRQLLMKRNADQEQRKDPPPPYPEQTRPLPKKSTGPPGPGRGSAGSSRGQGPSQRTILPKPNEQTTQKSTGEHKMERDAHERWLQLSQEQQSVILAAAKEKVSKLKKNELQLLLNAAYQHMHKVPPDMRKALLIAAQERMDKLSGRSSVEQTAASSTTQVPAAARKPAPAKNKDDDDLVILQEVPCRESRTKVTIRDETGEVVTLLGRPAESLPRQTSRYSQTWRSHFSGCARTRAIVKTAGLPTTLLPDLSVWRERESEAASVTSSCARVRPYHRAVGTKSRIKRTGGTNGQDKRFPVRQEVSKIVTRLRKFHCERSRGTKASELTNVFSLTDEGLDDVAECIARAYAKEKKRIPPSERRRGRPSRQVPVSKPLGPQMPKITVCRSSGETPLHKSAQQGWLESVRQCLQAGEDINVRDNAGWTPLHEATAKNRIEVVTLLLEQNADVNVASSTTGVRPIHDAVLHDYVEIAGLLLAAGADPKLPTFSGKLPSDFCRSTAMSELLDKYIAKLSSSGATPPGWSAECLMELSDLPHMPVYKLALQGDEEKNYYLLTDLIARLNISRSTFSQNYPAFKTYRMKWKDFAKLLGKSPYFVHPERLPSQVCEFIELNDDANRILNIRSEMFEP